MRTFLMWTLISFAACGDDGPQVTNNQAIPDAGSDVEADVAPVLMCPDEGELFCDGRCINGQISMDHCGSCDNSCQVGAQTCRDGVCACLSGKELCGNRCYDLSTTHDFCGDCNTRCLDSEACVDSLCVFVNDRAEVLGVLDFTNQARSAQQDCGVHGLERAVGPLQLDELLSIAAQAHADDMAQNNFMAHEGSDGSDPFTRADRVGYQGSVGENVARGYDTPQEVVAGWIDSDGHCTNMMNGNYSELGVGYAVSNSGEKFWVQLFGTP